MSSGSGDDQGGCAHPTHHGIAANGGHLAPNDPPLPLGVQIRLRAGRTVEMPLRSVRWTRPNAHSW